MMDYTSFGRTVAMIRKEKGLSQTDMSEIAGCDRSYVSMVERGVCIPTLKTMHELSEALGWSVYQVLEASR